MKGRKLPATIALTLMQLSKNSDVVEPAAKALSSGEGSDMDMEDDFAPTDPNSDKDPTLDSSAAILVALGEAKSGRSSPQPERKPRVSFPSTRHRLDRCDQVPDRKILSATDNTVSDFTMGPKWNASNERELSLHGTHRELPNQDLRLNVQSCVGNSKGNMQRLGGDLSHKDDAVSEGQRRRVTVMRRKTGFDRQRMENVSPDSSFATSRVRQNKESHSLHDLERKESFRNGRASSARASRWGPESLSDRVSQRASNLDKELETKAGNAHGQGERSTDVYSQTHSREESAKAVRSADAKRPGGGEFAPSATNQDKDVPKSGSDRPAVDEFGRLLRQGGSDSDADDSHHGAGTTHRRFSRSQSRSISPSSVRFRRRSPGHSPHRRWRRSRSRSRSPRRNKSRSRSPPRWGDGRVNRGARRGARSGPGEPSLCHDFVRGKCFRGSSCKYSHDESQGLGGDQKGRWSGGRGRDQEHDRSGVPAEERDRRWGSRGGDDVNIRKQSQFDIRAKDEVYRDAPLDDAKQKAESRNEDSSKQGIGKFMNSIRPCGTENYVTPSEFSSKIKGLTSPPAHASFPPQSSAATGFPLTQNQPSAPASLDPSRVPSSLLQNANSSDHKLGNFVSPVPHQQSFMVSPSQKLQFPPNMSQSRHTAFPAVSQTPNPPIEPSSSMGHDSGFAVNASSQQPAFSPALNVQSASPSLLALAPPFAISGGPPQGHLNTLQPNPPYLTPQAPPLYKHAPSFNGLQPPLSYGTSISHPSSTSSPQQHSSFNSSQLPSLIPSHPPSSYVSAQPPPNFKSSQSAPSFISPLPAPSKVSQQNPSTPFASSPAGSFNSGQQIQSLPISSANQFQPPGQPQKLPPQPGQSLPPGNGSQWMPSTKAPLARPMSQSLSQVPPTSPPVQAAQAGSLSYTSSGNFAVPSNNDPPRPAALMHDQYDPLADSLEPGPSRLLDRKALERMKLEHVRFISNSKGPVEMNPHSTPQQWSSNADGLPGSLMTNAGEVVLENVSPGLPSHADNVTTTSQLGRMSGVNARPEVSIEDLSPTTVSPTHEDDTSKLDGVQHQMVMENVSPPAQDPSVQQDHMETGLKGDEEKRKLKETKVLNLVRKAVVEHVKELLNPRWKSGNMSKEAFKTIAKKAVDKVMSALESKGQIPKSNEKLESFMKTSKPKIAKLVQGYLDKYGRV